MSESDSGSATESRRQPDVFGESGSSDTIEKKAASGGLIAIVGQFLRMVLVFGASAVLARLLTPADFGLVAMALAVTSFVGIFTDIGLNEATVQRREIDPEIVSGLFMINVGVGLLVSLIVFAIAPVAAWALDEPRLVRIVMALGLAVPFTAAGAQHNALLRRRMRWMTLQVISLGSLALGALVAIVVAAFTSLGYWALAIQVMVVAVTGFALSWLLCPWRPAFVKEWGKVRESLVFGLQLTGFNLLNYFHRQFDKLLIGRRWSNAHLGFYGRAYSLFLLPLTALGWPLGAAMIPVMSRLQADPQRWRRLYLVAIAGLALVTAPLAAGLVLFAEPLVLVVYGPQWRPAIPILQILAVSLLIQPISSTAGWVCVSLGRTRRLAFGALLATPVYCAAFLAGLPFGAQGVAAGYSCATVTIAIPRLWWLVRGSPVSLVDIGRVVAPPILCTILSYFAVAYGLDVVVEAYSSAVRGPVIRGVAFLACYSLALWLSWFGFPVWREHLRLSLEHLRAIMKSGNLLNLFRSAKN